MLTICHNIKARNTSPLLLVKQQTTTASRRTYINNSRCKQHLYRIEKQQSSFFSPKNQIRNIMKVTFLGTSSGVPTSERNVSNINLSLESGNIYMFDCGEGTQHQFQKSVLKSGKITTIFITHLHGDHVFGLPGLLCTLSGNNPPTRTEVHIYGPLGLGSFIRSCLRLSDSHLAFKLCIHELVPYATPNSCLTANELSSAANLTEPSKSELLESEEFGGYIHFNEKDQCYHVVKQDGVTVKAAPIHHRVFTVGYVIEEDASPGKLDMAKAIQLGVPKGAMLGKLKNGQDVTLSDGRVVKSSDVVGSEQKGRKVVILGDTHDPSPLATIAMDCDLITHESTLSDSQRELAIERGHSCPSMAASFALQVRAKNLVLTHFSARFSQEGVKKNEKLDSLDILKDEAMKVYTTEHGSLFLANDFRSFTVLKDGKVVQEQHEPRKGSDDGDADQ